MGDAGCLGAFVNGCLKVRSGGVDLFTQTGFLYVADRGRNQVVVFDAAGEYVTGFAEGEEHRIIDVAARYGRVYVVDAKLPGIRVFEQGTWREVDPIPPPFLWS